MLLEVRELSKAFGGLLANRNISFSVDEGEILAIIGPNGAGKSTLFNCLTGFIKPTSGQVIFQGHNIVGFGPMKTARLGLMRTFQIPRSFTEMTLLENVMVGALLRERHVGLAHKNALEMLEKVGLGDRANAPAASLSIASRKRLELARGLATQPRLLLLDEVAGGLNPSEVQELVGILANIHADGITLILVEHVLEVVMQLAQKVVVMDYGQLIARGTPTEVVQDEHVIEAYLGRRHSA